MFQFKLRNSTILSSGNKIQEVFQLKTGNDPLTTFEPLSVTITCAPTQAKSHDLYLTSSLVIHTKYEFLNIFRL